MQVVFAILLAIGIATTWHLPVFERLANL